MAIKIIEKVKMHHFKKTFGGANTPVSHLDCTFVTNDDIQSTIDTYLDDNKKKIIQGAQIGSGTYGTVYRGTKDGKDCVLKFIEDSQEINLDVYVMSCREVAIGKDLSKKNIAPQIYDSRVFISEYDYTTYIKPLKNTDDLTDGLRELNLGELPSTTLESLACEKFQATVLIVQEYIGETLQTYLEKETTADNTPEADNTRENANSHRKDLAHLLLQNVNTLHCEKYAHRDLKPNNLFVKTTLDGKPTKLFIGDYGLAVHSGRIRKPSFPNTHYYWGPEMNVSKHIHMQKVDSWSVGMILLELLYNTKSESTNILHQNDIDTYLDTKCTPDKCCIGNHQRLKQIIHKHLKQIIHSLLLYYQKDRWTVYDALLEFENVFSLQSQPPPPQPPQPLPPLPSPKTSNLKEDQSPDAKNTTMKIAFTLALLTATAMLMAKEKKTNTRRQLFTQKR